MNSSRFVRCACIVFVAGLILPFQSFAQNKTNSGGFIGAPARRDRIIRTLREMSTSKDDQTREHAETALKRIGN